MTDVSCTFALSTAVPRLAVVLDVLADGPAEFRRRKRARAGAGVHPGPAGEGAAPLGPLGPAPVN